MQHQSFDTCWQVTVIYTIFTCQVYAYLSCNWVTKIFFFWSSSSSLNRSLSSILVILNNKHTSYKSTPKGSSAMSKHLYANLRTLEMTTWRRALYLNVVVYKSHATSGAVKRLMSLYRDSNSLDIKWIKLVHHYLWKKFIYMFSLKYILVIFHKM